MLSVANVRTAGGAATYFAADNYYTRADADRRAVLHIDDGVRLHVLADLPGEQQVLQFLRPGGAPGDDLEVARVHHPQVARLQQQGRTMVNNLVMAR